MRLAQIAAFATLAVLAATPAAAMTFERITGPPECAGRTCAAAAGLIDQDTPRAFQAFAKENNLGPGTLVALNSAGGNVMQSLTLGALFRKAGVSTTVRDYDSGAEAFGRGGVCSSACVYAFLGGVERSVADRSRLGVHQAAAPEEKPWLLSASDGQWLMSLVAVHLNHMGAKLELLTLALRTRPQDMRWLSEEELVRYAVVTASEVAAD